MKPGDIDGRRGDSLRRFSHDGRLWHQHLEHREYRYKIIGKELWPLKEGEEIDPATIRTVQRAEIVGLELVSGKEHWWLDTEIKRPNLQQGDWDFRTPLDGDTGALVPLDHKIKVQHDRQPHAWQLPWALEYEYWREWQPYSDFERWQNDWRKEVKRFRDPSAHSFCGKRTLKETESDAAFTYGGLLPLWILRDFANYFPHTPWVKIPYKKRKQLERVPLPGSCPISLQGSLLELRADAAPETAGSPFEGEYLDRYRRWLEGPGHYRREEVREIARGHFVGTYIISVPWNHPDTALRESFNAWLTKHAPKRGDLVRVRDQKGYRTKPATHDRKTQEMTGREKPFARLKQLGALRLWREMTVDAAIKTTRKLLKDKTGEPCSLFGEDSTAWYRARRSADSNLQAFFGIT